MDHPKRTWRPGRQIVPALAFTLCASLAPAQTSWVKTATQAIPLQKATSLGPLAPSTPLRLAIALKMRNQSGLKQLVREQHTPGNGNFETAITPSEFLADYAPTASQVQAVESYLASQGLTNIQHESNHLFITANATAAQASTAFHTSLASFRQNARTVYVNTQAAQVPAALGGTVLSVLGLSNAGVMRTPYHKAGTPTGSLSGLNAKGLQIAYDAQNANGTAAISTGAKTSVAIFTNGDLTQVVKDLRQYESVNKLPQVPYSIVPVGLHSPDTSGQDEWDLDSQSSTGIAQAVKHLYFYDTTSLSDSDVALMFNRFAAQDVAQIGNASFGLCEFYAYLDGSMLADDEVFLEAAAQGQTVFASTGDNGSACPVAPTNGVPLSGAVGTVLYPASSPYVTAVGGTTLTTDSGTGAYVGEAAWYGGGGGASAFETAPYWQSGVAPASAVGKGLPDVAMDADPNTGAIVYVSGVATQIGGTSLASPLAAGAWARVQSSNLDDPSHPNEFGFASPALYSVYAAYPTTPTTEPVLAGPPPTGVVGPFHDILVGTNGLFTSLPRYDYNTGLGSIDIKKLAVDIELHEPGGQP